ncbi:hypothetical protein MY4038_008320 [Beauveria bassiana]|uniref:Uncharacterized protein n=1 Tax=Beauveria bassiana TaxID=176275 RepID=A0A2S7YKS9_BEABA|nr:hypothetical protein BB8028_0006g10160 [Beauveria bassiana]
MASKGGVNFVRYFFYKELDLDPSVKEKAIALAYATARDQKLAPTRILIRARLHNTTSIGGGKHGIDPKGWHLTMAFKDEKQEKKDFHVASHGYTTGKDDYVLKLATHGKAKRDDTPRGRKGKVVWPKNGPADDELEEYEGGPIAYSHLPKEP